MRDEKDADTAAEISVQLLFGGIYTAACQPDLLAHLKQAHHSPVVILSWNSLWDIR